MKLRKISVYLLSATFLFAAPVAQGFAQTENPAQTQNKDAAAKPADAGKLSPKQLAAMKKLDAVSEEGYAAVRGIALARLAIFQGKPDEAKTILTAVRQNIEKAQGNTASLADKLTQANSPKDEIDAVKSGQVPIDFAVGINDDYTMTPENAKHLENANKHLGSGKTQEAVEELKLANVNVSVTETDAKLPVLAKVVATALSDLDNKNYYEANLTLIKADDAITSRSITEDEPASKTPGTGTTPAPAPAPAAKPAQ
ncbi:YfdX family protein [Phyllobacterium leguminum]|uniref:YfdX protein n=1 Tax=Phyllobacterium leguminum TaxID=314237 RepID=A0A318T4V8_9HYPH|nr:YfdX family protein [Phyllobacterium leguminum]PYE87843.1 YfdX protein [Phyllobacterium leguminum]